LKATNLQVLLLLLEVPREFRHALSFYSSD